MDSTGSYTLSEKSTDRIVQLLKESRVQVKREIVKTNKKFSEQGNFKILERVDLPYGSISGIIWGSDFAYCYTKDINLNKIKIQKITQKALGEKSGISSNVIKEVSQWNVNLLKRMVLKPVNTWDKNYTNFLDSLKNNTSYNLAQTGDVFYIATNVERAGNESLKINTVAFDGF